MNINYENVKAAYYRGQNILKIYSGSTLEWEYETEPMEQTTKQIWYNSVSGDVVEPYAASAIGSVVSNTAYESKCVLEFASDVTAIGANAFSGCTDLEYVSIPVNAISIGDNAFDGCSALDEIYMPSVQRIGRESFKDCAFSSFTISSAVTAITADAFKGVAIEDFNYNGTKAQWQAITTGDFWDEDTWITNVVHCSDGDIELYQYDYSKRYLEFVATSGGTIKFDANSSGSTANTISYSTDQGKTWSTPASSITVNVNSGDTVMFKGQMTPINNWQKPGIGYFSGGTATFNVEGNVMSLLYGDNFVDQNILPQRSFENLFKGSKVENASQLVLPATNLAMWCYQCMFADCPLLISTPQLPATTIGYNSKCYCGMFQGCTSLTTAPALPASTLFNGCYQSMFQGCTSLTTAPVLSATTLASECYRGMFEGCSSLTQAPTLPATTMAASAYTEMFKNCTSLTTAPSVLPATTLADKCYRDMFYGCTSLTQAPQLPATTLASSCYLEMFQGCTSLATAPQLPATTLAASCYDSMFESCINLTTPPSLPATTLANACYQSMFYSCSKLETAPELLAPTLVDSCYHDMFNSCSKLNYIKMLATDISASNCLNNWVTGVANSGTFVKAASMTSLPTGSDGIPNGWTVQDDGASPTHDYSQDYFTIVAKEDGEIQVQPEFVEVWNPGDGHEDPETGEWIEGEGYLEYYACPVQYSVNDGVWETITADTSSLPDPFVIEVSTGDEIRFKCNLADAVIQPPYNMAEIYTYDKPCSFASQGASFDVQGNIMSLVYGDDFENNNGLTYEYTYVQDEGEGPVETTGTRDVCFASMFENNEMLVSAENLVLPATTLATNCYSQMFYGCTSLTTPPSLPATTLASYCYSNMFSGCTSLTQAPQLPATTLADACYQFMFYGCSSLNYIKMLATNVSTYACLNNWVYGVAQSGTFVKDANTTLPSGDSGIPNGWTVEDAA